MTTFVTNIVKNKLFAILLGPFGIGLTSQMMNFYNFYNFCGSIGLPLGITRFVSIWEKENKWDAIYYLLQKSIIVLVFVGFISFLVVFYFSDLLSVFLFSSIEYNYLVKIIAICLPLMSLTFVLDSFLRGLKEFAKYSKLSIINIIVSTIIFVLALF